VVPSTEPPTNPSVELDVVTSVDGTSATVSISGELDVYTAPELRTRLHELVDGGVGLLTLDLAGLSFIDSSGLGVIVGALKRLRERDGTLQLRAPSRSTAKVLEITGLAKILDVVD
jgi:anti-sigma B factor antagonist